MSYSHAPGGALCEWMEEVSSGRVMQSDTNRKVPCWKQRCWWEAAAAEWLLCFKTLQATVLQTGSFFTGDQVMKKGLNLKDNKKRGFVCHRGNWLNRQFALNGNVNGCQWHSSVQLQN